MIWRDDLVLVARPSDPENADAFNYLAHSQRRLGDCEAAIERVKDCQAAWTSPARPGQNHS